MMIRDFKIKTNKGAYDLEASVRLIGKDLLVAIWGGEKPHIGAVAMAQPRPSLRDKDTISATASVFCFLGHKEDLIAKEASERIASAFNTNVVLTAGVHWDAIDEAGIGCVVENSRELTEMIIERMSRDRVAR